MSAVTFQILDASDASLNKTSVIVAGDSEAVVVDPGFTLADGHRLVAALLDANKAPKAVLITAGDPDFYFGAEVLADAFPGVPFLAPADVIAHIRESYEGKLQAWAQLGANLPTRLIELTPFEGALTVDCTDLELRHAEALGDHGWYVYVPSQSALLGGVVLFEGLHVWTADNATPESRAPWIAALDDLEALAPTFVVAGHRVADAATDLTAIRFTRQYLRDFDRIIAESPDAATAEAALVAAYPEAGLRLAVTLGTKVAKGEMTWG